jgi:DNA-binding FrmR family transcriptional regulator
MPPAKRRPPELYDEEARRDLCLRLGKVEGQLRGIGRMIIGQKPAGEVLQQLASVRSAVKGVTKAVLRAYLEKRGAEAIACGDRTALDDLLETLVKFVKE